MTTNTFISYKQKNVGTSPATLVTAASATQTTAIGFTIANTSVSPIAVSVYVTASGVNYYLLNNTDIAVGGSIALFGSDGKLVLNTGDAFNVISNLPNSADAILSCLQIS